MSRTDHLTGLPNRRDFELECRPKIKEILRQAPPAKLSQNGAFFMIDLDHFKGLNDAQGHDFGDRVLRLVGQQLSSSLRSQDMIARLGGEEFCVFVKDCDRSAALTIAERLRADINALELKNLAGIPVEVSASIGIALACDFDRYSQFVRAADIALFDAKVRGRNCVSLFTSAMFTAQREADAAASDDGLAAQTT